MNFFDKIQHLKIKLKDYGYKNYHDDILQCQLKGGTGGEVLISVCSKLLEIKRKDYEAFKLVEKETVELIEYAQTLNLYPR